MDATSKIASNSGFRQHFASQSLAFSRSDRNQGLFEQLLSLPQPVNTELNTPRSVPRRPAASDPDKPRNDRDDRIDDRSTDSTVQTTDGPADTEDQSFSNGPVVGQLETPPEEQAAVATDAAVEPAEAEEPDEADESSDADKHDALVCCLPYIEENAMRSQLQAAAEGEKRREPAEPEKVRLEITSEDDKAKSQLRETVADAEVKVPRHSLESLVEDIERGAKLPADATGQGKNLPLPDDGKRLVYEADNTWGEEILGEEELAERSLANETKAKVLANGEEKPRRTDRSERWFERRSQDGGDRRGAVKSAEEGTQRNDKDAGELQQAASLLERAQESPGGGVDLNTELTTPGDAAVTPPEVPVVDVTSLPVASLDVFDAARGAIASEVAPGAISGSAGGEASADSGSSVNAVDRSAAERGNTGRTASGGATANDTAQSTGTTQAERMRLVQRVARSFSRLGPDGGEINLKLHPPQLGTLNVQVKLEGRSMTAKLTAESAAAQEVLLEGLPQLRSRLAEQGFEISQFQVDIASNGSDAGFSSGREQQAQAEFAQSQRERRDEGYRSAIRSLQDRRGTAGANVEEVASSLLWSAGPGVDVKA